jgi:hypothetical protein
LAIRLWGHTISGGDFGGPLLGLGTASGPRGRVHYAIWGLCRDVGAEMITRAKGA